MMEHKHLEILVSILSSYPYTFYMFGSRVMHTAKKFSDVDLFYKEAIPNSELIELEAKLEESDLPYKVDIIDYNRCDESFKKIMDRHNISLSACYTS